MNADARRCSVRLIGVNRRFPTLGGMRSLAINSECASYRPVIHGRDARATVASWHGRPGHDTKLDGFVSFVSTKGLLEMNTDLCSSVVSFRRFTFFARLGRYDAGFISPEPRHQTGKDQGDKHKPRNDQLQVIRVG